MKLFTIGHSAHSPERFVELLNENGVMSLVDVRSAPYSRFHSQFNRENLEQELPQSMIEYAYAGDRLGGRPKDPNCYKSRKLPPDGADYLHEVDYPEMMKRPWFKKGIEGLLTLADQQTTAIMCSEEDPALCHRHHLIAKYILREFPEFSVQHIRGDGNVYAASSILKSLDEEKGDQLSLLDFS